MKRFLATGLKNLPGLVHGFGLASVTVDDYLRAQGAGNLLIPKTHQSHSDIVHILRNDYSGELLTGDAFVTASSQIVCAVRTADCVPLLVVDPKRRAIGATHAGWRGAAGGIVTKTLQRMREAFGSSAEDLRVAIGPAICGDCYEVGDDVIAHFSAREKAIAQKNGRWHLDLVTALEMELAEWGVSPESIETLRICTKCSGEPLASYRRAGDRSRSDLSLRSGLSPGDRQVSFLVYL